MRLENDNVLNELYDEEIGKIPFIFRFSRKRFIIAFVAVCVLLIATIALVFALYGSGSYQLMDSVAGNGYQMGFNVFDDNIATVLLFTVFALCMSVVWVIAGKMYEDRAFKKASHLAQMIRLSEHRLEMRRWEKIRTDSRF